MKNKIKIYKILFLFYACGNFNEKKNNYNNYSFFSFSGHEIREYIYYYIHANK